MNDDFAASRGVSALSVGTDVLVVDRSYGGLPFDRLNDSSKEEEFDYAPTLVSAVSAEPSLSDSMPPPAPPQVASQDELVIHIYRGTGDANQLEPLLLGLKRRGWSVVEASRLAASDAPDGRVEPAPAVSPDGCWHVALGMGLGGARAMWDSWDGRAGGVHGVVAVCPFLGFDAPIYRSGDEAVGAIRQRAFDLARKPGWRPVFSRLECVSAYVGLGSFADQAISWSDLVEAAPFPGFGDLMSHLTCPTALVLDAEDPDLDIERAKTQIPAMNAQVALTVCPLVGEQLVLAVDDALVNLLAYYRGAGKQAAMPVSVASYGMRAK